MTKEILGTDLNGRTDYSLPTPTSCWNAPLTANTILSITTPANYNRAFFSFGAGTNVWVTFDGTSPVVPNSSAASTQELNPGVRQISTSGGQTIKFISDTASYINVRYDVGQ